MWLDSPVARAFLDQRKDLQRTGGAIGVQAVGSLLGAVLLRMAAVSNPVLWAVAWGAHEAFQQLYVQRYLSLRVGHVGDGVEEKLRNRIFWQARRNRVADGETSPEVVNRDIDEVVAGWNQYVPFAALNALTLAGSVIGAFIVAGPVLGLAMGGASALVVWQGRRQMKQLEPLDKEVRDAQVSFFDRVRKFVAPDARAYHHSMGIADEGVERGEEATARVRRANAAQRIPHLNSGRWIAGMNIAFATVAFIMGAATGNWITALGAGMLATRAFQAATTITPNMAKLGPWLLAMKEVNKAQSKRSPVSEHPNAVDLRRRLRWGLEFKDVTVKYNGKVVLDELSFRADPGKITLIMGPNGAGKTTALNVAQHLVNVDSGLATIDGIDVQMLSDASLSDAFCSYVPTGTLRQTLLHAKPDATEDEMWSALETAGVGRRLKTDASTKGLDTLISTETVSPGIRAKIDGARWLLKCETKNPPKIALFDESTAALDARGLEESLAVMRKVRDKGAIVLAVAHNNPGLAKAADHVVLMDKGRVLRQGHPSLLWPPDFTSNIGVRADRSPAANRKPGPAKVRESDGLGLGLVAER